MAIWMNKMAAVSLMVLVALSALGVYSVLSSGAASTGTQVPATGLQSGTDKSVPSFNKDDRGGGNRT